MIVVDKLRTYGPQWYHGKDAAQAARVGARSGHRWSHLMTDGPVEELHALAKRIGLKRAWWQGDHYDVNPTKRAMAIKAGAVAIEDDQEWMVWLKQKRMHDSQDTLQQKQMEM